MEDPQVYDEDDYRPAMSDEPMEPENSATVATPERNNNANANNTSISNSESIDVTCAHVKQAPDQMYASDSEHRFD